MILNLLPKNDSLLCCMMFALSIRKVLIELQGELVVGFVMAALYEV